MIYSPGHFRFWTPNSLRFDSEGNFLFNWVDFRWTILIVQGCKPHFGVKMCDVLFVIQGQSHKKILFLLNKNHTKPRITVDGAFKQHTWNPAMDITSWVVWRISKAWLTTCVIGLIGIVKKSRGAVFHQHKISRWYGSWTEFDESISNMKTLEGYTYYTNWCRRVSPSNSTFAGRSNVNVC